MSSNLFSRFLPPAGEPSIYEAIREHEEPPDHLDPEDDAGVNIDEQNFGERFHDQDVEHLLAEAAESQTTTQSNTFTFQPQPSVELPMTHQNRYPRVRPRWAQRHSRDGPQPSRNDDVPESLLLQNMPQETQDVDSYTDDAPQQELPYPVPGPSAPANRVKWDTAREQQPLYNDQSSQPRKVPASLAASGYLFASAEEKAMWRWVNVENLDSFLTDIYYYYVDKGIWCIVLRKSLQLLTVAFVVGFGIFLTYCVDYKILADSKSLPEVIIPKCMNKMPFFNTLFLWLGIAYWIYMAVEIVFDLRRLRHLHDFYLHLLGVSDKEMQTISWQEIVGRLMNLRDDNPRTALKISPQAKKFVGEQSKDRMDAHDIANRIMRKENYYIAMINKDILDFTLPIPYLRNRQLYSRNLEWNVNQCIMSFAFNSQGQVYQYFLKDTDRKRLIEGLRRRFVFFGFMNLLQAPFLITYYVMTYFFRYFTEFQQKPAQIGSRTYTRMAEWKFREFNELWHFFQRRMDMSVPFASRYLDQFPKNKTVQVAHFVAFVSGALAAVLFIASALDHELFLNFEITPGRTVLFYLGLFTLMWSVARGVIPEDNLVFDPEYAIENVISYTHYSPTHWKDKLHTEDVRKEFASLYQMKLAVFLEELLSILFAPLILWFTLPKCSDRIVDFFREFTVHVDGLGYVCSFALFEFKKGDGDLSAKKPAQKTTEPNGLREDYYASKDNKMLASYFSFIDSYANNPRRGMHRNTRSRFHPPPAFPGLDPSLPAAANPTLDSSIHPQTQLGNPATSQQFRGSQAPRSTTDPSPSLLLDPHHQPRLSVSRRFNRQPGTSSFRHSTREPALNEADDETDPDAPNGPAPLSSSVLLENDPHLGDSWKMARAALDDEPADDTGADEGEGRGAGVLGLLYQFQKAATETRGTGMGGL